jgi:hypothetical protein
MLEVLRMTGTSIIVAGLETLAVALLSFVPEI